MNNERNEGNLIMDFGKIDLNKQERIENKVALDVANKIADELDRADSPEKKADKKFDKQEEIFQALGIGKKDENGRKEFTFGETVYEKIQSKLAVMVLKVMGDKDFTAINNFLKQFNIKIDVKELIKNGMVNASLYPQEDNEEPHGCTHMHESESPLNYHNNCK